MKKWNEKLLKVREDKALKMTYEEAQKEFDTVIFLFND